MHHFNSYFLLYVFLLMTLLAVYFMFILDYRNNVRQDANLSDFLSSSSKMGHKAEETIHNSNNAFGPGTANEIYSAVVAQEVLKGDKSLEDEEHSGWPLEVDSDQLR